jgi:hypothetical protein
MRRVKFREERYLYIPSCRETISYTSEDRKESEMPCEWVIRDEWKVTTNLTTAHWADPMVGLAKTDNFVAALSSALFSGQPLNLLQRDEKTRVFRIRFFSNQSIAEPPGLRHHDDLIPRQTACVDVTIDEHLPVDDTGTLVWARNRSDPTDIWPCLYEKAYLALCAYQKEGLFKEYCAPVSCAEPGNSALPLSTPSWDCARFSGSRPEYGNIPLFHLMPYSKNRFVEPPYVSELAKICDEKGRVTKPAMTWTKDSIPGGDCPRTRINYVYSVLGLFPDALAPTEVVLRDPKGEGSGLSSHTDWNGISLNKGDGVLTITSRVWEKCFRRFSYCY